MTLPVIGMTHLLVISALLVCLQNSDGAAMISQHIGGRVAVRGQFPWQVQIMSEDDNKEYYCGGAIIGRRWILTAAHCYEGRMPSAVYCGGLLKGGKDAELVVRELDAFIEHELYVARRPEDEWYITIPHDIALIKLSGPLKWSANIKPVSLPRYSQEDNIPYGSTIVSSGWDIKLDENEVLNVSSPETKTLLYLKLKLGEQPHCQLYDFLCTKWFADLDKIRAEDGGPVVWVDPEGVTRLVGVTIGQTGVKAYGEEGIEYMGETVSVAKYLEWIEYQTDLLIED